MSTNTVLWTGDEAKFATGGHTAGDWRATGVSIDSRTVAAGDLFVAIKGPTFDGHDFVTQALANGAVAAIVSRVPPGLAGEDALLVVPDTLKALENLGRAARARSTATIIGVTGSVGKTGVKEALRTVLSEQGLAAANDGSLNNHWGLPLSLARMPRDADFGVFEIGMNHPGEIESLARLAKPHVAVIVTVEAVHKAFFDSVEAIADAKAEIFAGLAVDGKAVLNRDNPHYVRLTHAARRRGISTIIDFGHHADADVRLVSADLDATGARIQASAMGEPLEYRLNIAGAHWVMNSLCVLAAVAAAGADVRAAASALAAFRAPKGRGRPIHVRLGGGALLLIDESYNASPVSMVAAFKVLGRMPPGPGGRRIAVLGDMLELGDDSPASHAGLARPLQDCGIDLVFAAGPAMAHLFKMLPERMRGGYAADSAALEPLIMAAIRPGDIVTIKGSAGSRMGRIVEALQTAATLASNRDPEHAACAANGG